MGVGGEGGGFEYLLEMFEDSMQVCLAIRGWLLCRHPEALCPQLITAHIHSWRQAVVRCNCFTGSPTTPVEPAGSVKPLAVNLAASFPQILAGRKNKHGVLFRGHAGLVINPLSLC